MAHRVLIERTIWTSKCPKCGDDDIRTESPPRERYCNECKQWVQYEKQQAVGEDTAVR